MIEMVIRLIVLTLAWFAVINAIVSGISALCALAVRRGETIARPRLLLTIRLLPATVSLLFAGAMFLPTHWMLEPRDAEETFGLMWYGLAAVGGFLIIRSGVRAVSIAIAGRRFRFSSRGSSLGPGRSVARWSISLFDAAKMRTSPTTARLTQPLWH